MWYFGTESSSFDINNIDINNIDIEGTRFCSEISHTRTDQTA
jgi:hypothetical protein